MKDSKKVRAGQIGALKRWGNHASKTLYLGDLTEDQRMLIKAYADWVRQGSKA